MKLNKVMAALAAAALVIVTFQGCRKTWQSSIELGVDYTRLNIPKTDAGTFTFPVYSGQVWTLEMTRGDDWLVPDITSSEGFGYVHFSYSANGGENARVASFLLRSESGKEITVYVVHSGMTQSASDLSDMDLL